MLNFKEYTLMSFKNIFQERFKNHFLKKAGKDIFKYQFGSGFLSALSVNGDNSKAIEYFVNLINTKDIYKDLYDSFLADPTPLKTKNYYTFAAYYMKLQGFPKGIPKVNNDLSETQNGLIALKEVFANELYEHLMVLNKGKKISSNQPTSIGQIKNGIAKTFVPDKLEKISDRNATTRPFYQSRTYFYKLVNSGLGVTDEENEKVVIKDLTTDLDLLFNGLNDGLPRRSALYNNLALTFDKSIFDKNSFQNNIAKFNQETANLSTISIYNARRLQLEEQNSSYRNTSSDNLYSNLLQKNGAYVEFYFKYDNVFKNADPSLTVFGQQNNKTNLKDLFGPMANNDIETIAPDFSFYSFREMLRFCMWLKDSTTEYKTVSGQMTSLTTPDLIKSAINFGIGARLVVATPALESFLETKITPDLKSVWLNKAFIYDLDGKEINCAPLANYEIFLNEQEAKAFLETIKNYNFIDFTIDDLMVSQYFDQIMNGLFEQEIVKKYSLSQLNSLNAVGSFYLDDDAAYKTATQGTILESENDNLKQQAGKMDNIIDQNLITLIDSVEAF